MDTKNQSSRVMSVFGILVLLASTVPAVGDRGYEQTVVIERNGVIGLGYQHEEAVRVLKLTIKGDPSNPKVWLQGDTRCSDRYGETLWRLVGKQTPGGNDRWRIHNWRGYGAFSQNFREQEGWPPRNYAAIIEGMLVITGLGGGHGVFVAGPAPEFSLRLSDFDADVDSLGRHQEDAGQHDVWPPTDVDHPLNELEDGCESGEGGGLAIPITDPGENLPDHPANFTGKAIYINANTRNKVKFYPMYIQLPKLALYRNRDSGTQEKVEHWMWQDEGLIDKIYYIHTCTGFTSNIIDAGIESPVSSAGTPGSRSAHDPIRVYLLEDGYQLFVNTPQETDDYVPVPTSPRVPVTVFREPSTSPDRFTFKIVDAGSDPAANHIKFYTDSSGGSEMLEDYMDQGVSSKTYWAHGSATGLGGRTIKLYKKNGENWEEKQSLAVTVYKLDLSMPSVYGTALPDTDEDSPGAYVRLNGDNDNGSPWVPNTNNHIPVRYDLNTRPIPGEDDLVEVEITVASGGVDLPGVFHFEATNAGRAEVDLWTTGTKTARFLNDGYAQFAQANVPSEFYVEGRVPGTALRDCSVKATYEPTTNSPSLPGDTIKITVTPVLEALSVVGVGAPGLVGGELSSAAGGNPAFTFHTQALPTNCPGRLEFVQNGTPTNHLNGGQHGATRGALSWTWDWADPNAGAGWLLDANPVNLPFYDFISVRPPAGNRVVLDDQDTPDAGPPGTIAPAAGQSTRVDISQSFRLYAVWVFTDRSTYFLGRTLWSVRYDGTLTRPAGALVFTPTVGGNNNNNSSQEFTHDNARPDAVTLPLCGPTQWR